MIFRTVIAEHGSLLLMWTIVDTVTPTELAAAGVM